MTGSRGPSPRTSGAITVQELISESSNFHASPPPPRISNSHSANSSRRFLCMTESQKEGISLLRPNDLFLFKLQAVTDKHKLELSDLLLSVADQAIAPYREEVSHLRAALEEAGGRAPPASFFHHTQQKKSLLRKGSTKLNSPLSHSPCSSQTLQDSSGVRHPDGASAVVSNLTGSNFALDAIAPPPSRAVSPGAAFSTIPTHPPAAPLAVAFEEAAEEKAKKAFKEKAKAAKNTSSREPSTAGVSGNLTSKPSKVVRVGSVRRTASMQLRVDGTSEVKRARFLRYFESVVNEDRCMSAEDLHEVIRTRGVKHFSLSMADYMLHELEGAAGVAEGCLEVEMLFELICEPSLQSAIPTEMIQTIRDLQMLLVTEDVEDSINKVSGIQAFECPKNETMREKMIEKAQLVFSFLVTLSIVISTITLGMSLDVSPEWGGWLALETLFTVIFLVELVFRICYHGLKAFFSLTWNQIDCAITMIATVQTTSELIWLAVSADVEETSGLRLTLMLRVLRVVRVTRLVKLLQMPFFAEFSTMINGLLIGMSPLASVMFLLFILIYVQAIVCRSTLGPREGFLFLEKCGSADFLTPDNDPLECPPHILYGEEYFSSVTESMHRVFTCLTTDCISKNGHSLPAYFGHGYGWKFTVPYILGSMATLFGIFNIITAKFIDTTMSGIKYNETQRRFAEMYEASYVRTKLQQLVERISQLHGPKNRTSGFSGSGIWFSMPSLSSQKQPAPVQEDFLLTRTDFSAIIEDPVARNILSDLDIHFLHNADFLDVLDTEGTGEAFLHEVILTLGKLRGGLCKSDMVAPTVKLAALTRKLEELDSKVASMYYYNEDTRGPVVGMPHTPTSAPMPPFSESEWSPREHDDDSPPIQDVLSAKSRRPRALL